MPHTATPPRAILRLSVQSEGRRLDVGVPASVPLIELMPAFARSLGVLDPTMTSSGYGLQSADGSSLDPSLGASAQGIGDGDVLTLTRGTLVAQPRVYDDIVEAVIDSTGQSSPWTSRDNARMALAASLTLLALCGVLLVAARATFVFGSLVAAAGAVVLLAVAAVVARLGQNEAGQGFAIGGACFAGLAGYLAASTAGPLWGWPLAVAGICGVVGAGIALAVMPSRTEVQLVPLTVSAAIAVAGGLSVLMPGSVVAVYALTVAVVGTLGGALPWLVLSSTRLRVISPQTDVEVFADPTPIDAEDVRRRAARGRRILVALRLAAGLIVVAAVPLVAASSTAGAALSLLAACSLMFPSRQAYSRSGVLAVMGVASLGIAVTGVTVAATQPGLRVALMIALAAATVIVVALTILTPKARLRLARAADSAELVVLASLLPLGAIAAGWV